MNQIIRFLKHLTKRQILILILVSAGVLVCASAGALCYRYQMEQKRALEASEREALRKDKIVIVTKKEEKPEKTEPVPETRRISFSGTSIEKDLKIKIVDESAQLVSGVAFRISVSPEGKENQNKEYADEDKDGIIYIEDMDAGKYLVKLEETEPFIITENSILVEVKAKIEYKKVNVVNEVKKESEVNTKKEDTAVNQVPEEKPIQDTVPLLESTVTTMTVTKQNVSTANFTKAYAGEEKSSVAIGQTNATIPKSVILFEEGSDASRSFTVTVQTDGSLNCDWAVSDSTVAGIAKIGDTSAKLTALQNGTATLSVTVSCMSQDGTQQSKTLQSTVTVSNMTDSQTQLEDLQGNGLYLDSSAKQIATLKNFHTQEVFYGSPSYTGWQTIDGKLYYFDANHHPVTGEQTIGNMKYTFREDGSLIETKETYGIDVSKWQGKIDWKAVAGAGIEFAIIRVGYRGSATGVLVEDPYFKDNISGATKAGLKVGVYFFTQAVTEAEAVEEASMAMELVKGYHLTYPIFIDTEGAGGDGRADSLNRSQRTKVVQAFCKTVQNGGYKPGVYASTSWYKNKLYAEQLSAYFIWVAQYNSECTYTGKYDMWQYTSSGKVSGISGNVDMNVCYKAMD